MESPFEGSVNNVSDDDKRGKQVMIPLSEPEISAPEGRYAKALTGPSAISVDDKVYSISQ